MLRHLSRASLAAIIAATLTSCSIEPTATVTIDGYGVTRHELPDGTEIDRPAGVGSLLVYDSEEAARRDYPNAPLQKVYLEPPEPEHLRA